MSSYLSSIQLGGGVPGGAEAAVHSLRRYANTMADDDIIVKLDFANAFNTIRRDTLMESIAKLIPQIYCFVHATYCGEPILQFMNRIIRSLESPQQGDPLASLEFFCSIHPLLQRFVAELRLGFMDDITLAGKSSTVAQYVNFIKEAGAQLGLRLNSSKCEIISKNTTKQFESSAFEGFQRIELDHLCLLGAPILRGPVTTIVSGRSVSNETKESQDYQCSKLMMQ